MGGPLPALPRLMGGRFVLGEGGLRISLLRISHLGFKMGDFAFILFKFRVCCIPSLGLKRSVARWSAYDVFTFKISR